MTEWGKKSLQELMAEPEMDFKSPLRFEFGQGSDQSGEYYTSVARFVDAAGHVIMDITCNGDWCDNQMHAVAAALNAARVDSMEAAVTNAKNALQDLIDWHDNQEAEADAVDAPGPASWHSTRRTALKAWRDNLLISHGMAENAEPSNGIAKAEG